MTQEEIKAAILRIIADHGVDIDDIESIDSIVYVTLIVDIEEHFGITLPDEVLAQNMLLDVDLLSYCVMSCAAEN